MGTLGWADRAGSGQRRYLPGQPRGAEHFGNILGADNQTLAGAEHWGLLPVPGRKLCCRSSTFSFAEPSRVAGGGFADAGAGTWPQSLQELWDPMKLFPTTMVTWSSCTAEPPALTPGEPLCSPWQLLGVTLMLLPARLGTSIFGSQHRCGIPQEPAWPPGAHSCLSAEATHTLLARAEAQES